MEFFQKLKSQITDFLKVVDPGTKLLAFMMIGVLFISVIIAVFMNRTPDFTLLFSNITESTAADIVKTLDDNNVEYELKNNGKNIYVKKDKANRVRLLLKAKGLPKDGDRVGFEIFDKTNLGVTDFVQNVQHHRALAGELERTISGIRGVEGVRVHIVIPEEKLFEKEKTSASATIMLTLHHEGALDASQIDGIRQLTSSSIEGMKPKNVTVVDNFGNVLASVEDSSDEGLSGISSRMALQKSVESYYIKKVQTLLDSVLGGSNSVVRIDALLDFDKIEETEEKYDPESAVVRTETITSEKASGATSSAKGPPGVQSNMSPANKSGGGSSQENQTSREVLNNKYEINKKVSHIIKSIGDVKKLTVSVFLKQKAKTDKNGDPVIGEDGKVIFEPRPPEEIKNFNEIVNNAIGFDEKRGDKVVIKEVPFDKKGDEAFFKKESFVSRDIHSAIAPGLKFILLFGLIFLFLTLLKKRLNHEGYSSVQTKHIHESGRGATGNKMAQIAEVYDAGELSVIKEKGLKAVEKGAFVESEISKLVENFPTETELVLKNWLKD